MEPNKVAREQQIAVFGESGSGKTVLLSCFYGDALEHHFKDTSLFDVVAEDTSQGLRLHQNFLGMKNSAERPMTNQFSATSYSFAIKQRKLANAKAKKSKQSNDLRLVWHDYPGQWFEQEPSGPVEAQRRVDTFRSLLSSDVALVLVDGQRLLDNSGEEGRYLKALLTNFGNGLLKLKDQLLVDGKPLVKFPRIWMMALSKSDLLPDLDVVGFRDLLVEKAGGEIVELSKVLAGLIEAPDALSVGEDFVLLSSAKFEPGKIEVAKRVGLQLILPLAAVLPFSRFVRWALAMHKGGKVAGYLLGSVSPLAVLIGGKVKLPGPLGLLGIFGGSQLAEAAAKLAGDKLKEMNDEAKAKHDYLTAMVTGFELALAKGEKERVLLRSIK
jgi:ABC-type uncharacterized transport system YnjBCD ATPase subunit